MAPNAAFCWRHRFLAVPRGVKPAALAGVAEIDETYVLEYIKGQKVVRRSARKRGLSREQIPILVARDHAPRPPAQPALPLNLAVGASVGRLRSLRIAKSEGLLKLSCHQPLSLIVNLVINLSK